MPAAFNIGKSGIVVAFFFCFFLPLHEARASLPDAFKPNLAEQLYEAAIVAKLDRSPVWSALLHAENGSPNITDPDFLLSLPSFSLLSELQQTINFLYLGERGNVCRFPARYLWLRQQLSAPYLPLDACQNVIEFRQKAPIEHIALVFASERISQPASMLGHAFLKFSGKNDSGQEVSHAISFYTDADTLNLPKLLFDSLIIGKKGYFSLSPYQEMQQRYVDEEQRNIWEYQLTLDRFQMELIRLHILELKQSHLTYFFQKYNCATVINYILALSGKRMQENGWWVTPKELIKNADHAGLIGETVAITPSRWMVRALADQVPIEKRNLIVRQVKKGIAASYLDHSGSESAFTQLELARAYNQYAYLSGELDKNRWIENDRTFAAVKDDYFPSMSLNTSDQYNPRYTPGENQISISAQNAYGLPALALTALPISHTLSDDNRNYAGESSLQLFATTLLLPMSGGRPMLDQLTFFDMESLMPYDEITGGSSSHFRIAVEPQLNSQLDVNHVFETSGSFGLTKRFAQDVDIYSMGGGGVGYTGVSGFIYTTFEAGMIMREVWDMKSWLSLTRINSQVDSGTHYCKLALVQSKFIDSTHSLIFGWERDFNNQNQTNAIVLTLKKIF